MTVTTDRAVGNDLSDTALITHPRGSEFVVYRTAGFAMSLFECNYVA